MTDLLFLTPILPCPTGHGGAMRASVLVDVLAERHRVFVANTGLWGRQGVEEEWVRSRAAGCASLPAQPDEAALNRLLKEQFHGAKFEALYVYYLGVANVAVQLQTMLGTPRPRAVLDLVDNDVERAERFIALREQIGDSQEAAVEKAALSRLQVYLKVFLPRFDTVVLCSERERDAMAKSYPHKEFVYVPNVVRPAAPAALPRDPARLMFVGTLDYLPNEDGVSYFCESVLPLLRESGHRCKVRIIGSGGKARVQALAGLPDVELTGFVRDLAPEFAQAGMLICPLRAGSGTRLKILEAISHECPVVSTHIGAEGLGLVHEQHCLLADSPAEFAEACRRMMTDGALRARLVANASEWFQTTHSVEQVRSALRDVV
ncbi:MAG: glycosyltransferase family 4 protein [Bryobacteraceae bacterium]